MNDNPCYVCGRHPSEPHHFVKRVHLSPAEIASPKFVIRLCHDHHINDLHSKGEYAFYKRHNLVTILTLQCDSDPRWMKWLAGQQFKHDRGPDANPFPTADDP